MSVPYFWGFLDFTPLVVAGGSYRKFVRGRSPYRSSVETTGRGQDTVARRVRVGRLCRWTPGWGQYIERGTVVLVENDSGRRVTR